jgi:adenine-specific DNA-methyltransferase
MRYLGSKAGVLRQVEELVPTASRGATFSDPFGGIGIVGAHFRAKGYEVHSGDILECAHAFQTARLCFANPPMPETLCNYLGLSSADEFVGYLNRLPPVRGWVVREFSDRRRYFTQGNALKIDAVRRELWRLHRAGVLVGPELRFYLASFISSADFVANTAGTYYAHLKRWDRKAERPFGMKLIDLPTGPLGSAYLTDAVNLVSSRNYDVLYLDPPYNARDYAGYYHLPETFATGRRPRPKGKSGVDQAPRPVSAFVRPKTATASVQELLRLATFKRLIFHYSDQGLVDRQRVRAALSDHGDVTEHVIRATGYSSSGSRETAHRLYLVER